MVAVGEVVLALVKAIVLTWGALTNWAYRLIYSSAKKVKNFNKVTGVYITLSFTLFIRIGFGNVYIFISNLTTHYTYL